MRAVQKKLLWHPEAWPEPLPDLQGQGRTCPQSPASFLESSLASGKCRRAQGAQIAPLQMVLLQSVPATPLSPLQQQGKSGSECQNPGELSAPFLTLPNPIQEKQTLQDSAVPSLLSPRPDFPRVSLAVDWEGRLKSRQLATALAPLTFTPAFPRPVGLNTLEESSQALYSTAR